MIFQSRHKVSFMYYVVKSHDMNYQEAIKHLKDLIINKYDTYGESSIEVHIRP